MVCIISNGFTIENKLSRGNDV